ncbi:tetratricopeptide repeat protein [Paraglaciecola marina]|uniref:tetratricopeptide repeat protein n=1 Tax=Paraglaciecola marina TaxID=2500157 RepID=UPI00105B3C84|nr:tetratricopeptide repeat protein [Paraglaciecola marina]
MQYRQLQLLTIILLYLSYQVELYAQTCEKTSNDEVGFSQAILSCKQAISELDMGSTAYVSGSLQLSILYRKSGDLGSSREILTELLSVLPSSLQNESILIHRQLGATLFYEHRYEEAFDAFNQALQIAKQIPDDNFIAISYSDIASIYQFFGDFETSSKLLLKSYDIHKANDNLVGKAIVLTNLGNIYRDKKAYDEAIVSYRQAFELHTEAGEHFKAAHTLSSLARTFTLAGNSEQASKLLEQAADIFNSLNAYKFKGDTYLLLAELHVSKLTAIKAQEWLNMAKQTFNLVQSDRPVAKLWFIQGLIWKAKGLNDKASDALEKSLASIADSDNTLFIGELYNEIASMKEESKEFEDASRYWKLYSDILNTQLVNKNNLNTNRLKSHFLFTTPENKTGPSQLYQRIYLFCISGLFLICLFLVYMLKRRSVIKPSSPIEKMNQHENSGLIEEHEEVDKSSEGENAVQEEELRLKLVELMLLAIQVWEDETNTSKLELAQKSKLWSVAVDDGRLRARALERYVSVNALPKNPRWRSVLRTCNFVLKNVSSSGADSLELETKMKDFQRVMKTKALKG